MNLTEMFFAGTKASTVVTINADGAMDGVYRGQKEGVFVTVEQANTVRQKERCWLAIPPGTCGVRNLQLDKVSAKEMEQALACLAQSSLLQPYEDGYVAVRCTQQDAFTMGVLFWCEKNFLEGCVARVEDAGFIVCGFLVPELLIGLRESCLLIYENRDACHGFRLVCHASPGSLPMVLSGTTDSGAPGRDVLYAAMLQEISLHAAPPPEKILFWQNRPATEARSESPLSHLTAVPGSDRTINHQILHGWAELLPHLLPQDRPPKSDGRLFAQCLNREKRQPLEPRGYFRLAAACAAALILLGAFIFTVYSQLAYDVASLGKEAARITRASQKAAKATKMIRNLQEKNSIIRKFVQDKPYSLELIKIIAEATAKQSRLESVSISRDGSIMINGRSKGPAYAMAIVEKLEESPKITQCKLTTFDHEADSDEYKFTIQARAETWSVFFQESET